MNGCLSMAAIFVLKSGRGQAGIIVALDFKVMG
jgi:hypothetical protein